MLDKYQKASRGLEETKGVYDELTSKLETSSIQKWLEMEAEAMEMRGEYLDIYHPDVEKGILVQSILV